jgi:predicted nuclease of predicted toxin-antitoxin system
MIKLYLDEDIHKKVATALRLKGYDVVSAHEVQKQSLTDHEQLDFAVSQGRAIFTFSSGDFNRLHAAVTSHGTHHDGIILAKQLSVGKTVKRLAKFLFSHSADEIKDNIYWILISPIPASSIHTTLTTSLQS